MHFSNMMKTRSADIDFFSVKGAASRTEELEEHCIRRTSVFHFFEGVGTKGFLPCVWVVTKAGPLQGGDFCSKLLGHRLLEVRRLKESASLVRQVDQRGGVVVEFDRRVIWTRDDYVSVFVDGCVADGVPSQG